MYMVCLVVGLVVGTVVRHFVMTLAIGTASAALLLAAVSACNQAKSAPLAWAYVSAAVWAIWVLSKGWGAMHLWDRLHLLWGVGSIVALYTYAGRLAAEKRPFEVRQHRLQPSFSAVQASATL